MPEIQRNADETEQEKQRQGSRDNDRTTLVLAMSIAMDNSGHWDFSCWRY